MPSSTTSIHNDRKIVFTESDHSYVDDMSRKYTSVTTLIGSGFEKFDSERVAKLKAVRENLDYRELMNQWKKIGEYAANAGTRLHENCEMQILGRQDEMHKPETPEESIKFTLAANEVDKLLKDKRNIKFEPEKIIFTPKFLLAGSVDLLVWHSDGSFTIYDWKNVKKIDETSFKFKTGILDATKDIQDSNYWHYALQLQLYEIIMKIEGYIPKDAKVNRVINAFEKSGFHQYEMPSLAREACELMKWNIKSKMI